MRDPSEKKEEALYKRIRGVERVGNWKDDDNVQKCRSSSFEVESPV